MNEFSLIQIADEHRVLKTIPMRLHEFANSPESTGLPDVVGNQVASSPRLHLVTIAV